MEGKRRQGSVKKGGGPCGTAPGRLTDICQPYTYNLLSVVSATVSVAAASGISASMNTATVKPSSVISAAPGISPSGVSAIISAVVDGVAIIAVSISIPVSANPYSDYYGSGCVTIVTVIIRRSRYCIWIIVYNGGRSGIDPGARQAYSHPCVYIYLGITTVCDQYTRDDQGSHQQGAFVNKGVHNCRFLSFRILPAFRPCLYKKGTGTEDLNGDC